MTFRIDFTGGGVDYIAADDIAQAARCALDFAGRLDMPIIEQTLDDLRWVLGGLNDINSGRRRNIGITRNCAGRLRDVIARLEQQQAGAVRVRSISEAPGHPAWRTAS